MLKVILKKIIKQLSEKWPDYLLQLIIIVGFGTIIVLGVTQTLKPETDISVRCEISKGINADYSLDLFFENKANFAGKQFYIYVWGINSSGWRKNYSVSEHCERKRELEIDYKNRLRIYCDFIPPRTNFNFSIDTNLNEEIINTGTLKLEWWGETTPYSGKRYELCTWK